MRNLNMHLSLELNLKRKMELNIEVSGVELKKRNWFLDAFIVWMGNWLKT